MKRRVRVVQKRGQGGTEKRSGWYRKEVRVVQKRGQGGTFRPATPLFAITYACPLSYPDLPEREGGEYRRGSGRSLEAHTRPRRT